MDYLEKNINKLKLNIEYEAKKINRINIDENFELVQNIDYSLNRSLFILFDIFSIEFIKKIYKKLDTKSIMILHYRDLSDLLGLLNEPEFPGEVLESNIGFTYGNINKNETKQRLTNLLKGISINLTNIQPIIKLIPEVNYIRHSKLMIKFIREFKENYFFLLGNDLNDTLIGIRNRLVNAKSYIDNPGLKEFVKKNKSQYENKPAVIVSSGPSLNKNIKFLEPFKDEALILSCDGSLTTLLKNKIIPDVIGSVERIYKTYEAFYKDRPIDKKIVFAGPAVVRPEIVNHFDNKFLSFFKDKDIYGVWMNEITMENKGVLWSGSSVAHMLMNLADELGCSPIILVGQDLAYSDQGISHATEAEVLEKIDLDKVEVWLEGVNGKKVPSTKVWKQFLHTFEEIIREKDIHIIDATEGGALIKGTEVLKFKDAINKYFFNEKVPRVRSLIDKIDISGSYKKEAIKNLKEKVIEAINKFDELLDHIIKYKKDNEESMMLIKEGLKTQKELDFIYDTLENIDENVVKKIAKDSFFMMLFQFPIMTSINKINSLKEKKFTYETILFNIKVHENLLDVLEVHTKKAIRVLVEGLYFVDSDVDMDQYNNYDFLNDSEYKITLV